jgi:phage gp36-like protein
MYATQQAMIDRYGERELINLTDRAEPFTRAIVETVLARAIASANAEVDASLRGRYTVPVTPAPELLVDIACDLARWRLYADAATETIQSRAKSARDQLDRLAKGQLRLDVPAAAPAPASTEVLIDAPQPIFGGDRMRRF